MLITAVVFALAAAPTFPLPQGSARAAPRLEHPWKRVLRPARRAATATCGGFLVCIVFYQAGIMAVIALAAIYAQEAMKFTSQQTIVLILVVNITAAIRRLGFGYLQDAIGHIKAMTLVLISWIVMIALAYVAESVEMFWVAANLAGALHGRGASLRPRRHRQLPVAAPERTAEFFGL